MTFNKILLAVLFTGLIVVIFACNKNNEYPLISTEVPTFRNQTGGTFQVLNDTVTYKVPVGVTSVSNVDRTFNFTVISNTGAVQGTQYTLNKTSVTVPAGKVLDSIIVKGIAARYTAGRKDTLKFVFNDKKYSLNDTFKLFMRGPCFEGDVDLNALRGTYAHTNELFGTSAYGPYTTTISAVTPLTATTGTITVTNIWDNGWGPLTFTLDWTDPNNRTVVPVAQPAILGSNAGDLSTTYAGQTIAMRAFTGQTGTFSACNNTLTLKMQLGVTNVGFFNTLYTVNMAR